MSHVWVGNLGALALAQETDMFIHGGFSLNIFNTASVEWCEDNGLSDVELSFELTAEQARRIGGRLPRGLIAYGRLPLMLTRNCPNRNGAGCSGCGEASSLKDRKGVSFHDLRSYLHTNSQFRTVGDGRPEIRLFRDGFHRFKIYCGKLCGK